MVQGSTAALRLQCLLSLQHNSTSPSGLMLDLLACLMVGGYVVYRWWFWSAAYAKCTCKIAVLGCCADHHLAGGMHHMEMPIKGALAHAAPDTRWLTICISNHM
jgi:hypothetical protein